MAEEYETADFEAVPLADDTAEVKEVEAYGIWNAAASLPHFLRHPTNRLAFQTWSKDSYCFRATCKRLQASRSAGSVIPQA